MNKTILISIIVVVLIILIGGYFLFYRSNQASVYNTAAPDNTNNAQNTNLLPETGSPASRAPNLTAEVSIKNFAFNPTPLIVKAGTTVTWKNNDSAAHQIKSPTFRSEALAEGQTFSFTFSVAGNYNYSCAIHPSMRGEIIVTK